MATDTITIHISPGNGSDFAFRVLNLAEDLYLKFHRNGQAEVPNFDSVTDHIDVILSSPRHLGTVSRAIRSEVRRHHLDDNATLSKRRNPPKSRRSPP